MKRVFAVLWLAAACGGGGAQAPATAVTPEAPAAPPPSQDEIMAEVRRGNEAYKAEDWATFLDAARAAQKLSPENPDLRYRVARALVRAGQVDEGLAELDRLAAMNLAYRIDKHPDFAALTSDPRFVAVQEKMARVVTPVSGGADLWTLPQRDLLVESIAHDERIGTFLLSTVHARKLMRVDERGQPRDFGKPADPGWGYFDMRADPPHRALWVGSSAMPHAEGFTEADKDRSALVRLNLDSGAVESTYELPGSHAYGDLTVARNGDVWVSDNIGGGIYRLPVGATQLEEVIPPGRLRSPQGLAFSADEKRLYGADYAGGLFVVDVASRRVRMLAHADTVSLYGIDGLVAVPGGLVGMQNGVQPHRVVRFRLDAAGTRVESAQILDMNDSVLEPTHAVLVDGDLYVVATSQWRNFDDDGKLLDEGKTTPAVIRKIPLGK